MNIIRRTPDGNTEINILAVFRLLWRKIFIIIIACVVGGGLFWVGSHLLLTPRYTAETTMYVNNSTASSTGTVSQSDLNAAARLVDTYSAIILSDVSFDLILEEIGDDITEQQLNSMISVDAVNDTEVFTVSVTDTDPERAAEIANIIAQEIPDVITSIVEGSSTKILGYATVPENRSYPSYTRFTIIGIAIGLIVSAAYIIIKEVMDRRIKSESDLDNWENIPVLGVVPELSTANKALSHYSSYSSYGD